MARLEIPSIVVHNGSNSAPGSPKMRSQRTLSKQAEVEEQDEDVSAVSAEQGPGAEKPLPTQEVKMPPPPSRTRSHSKVKVLVRSHAVREETSPPPDPNAHNQLPAPTPPPTPQQEPQQQQQPVPTALLQQQTQEQQQQQTVLTLSVSRPNSRHRVRRQGSADGSSPALSRDNSTEYTDNTGVDLQLFIRETLNKNHKDRMLLLKIEQEMVNFVKDTKRSYHKFPTMSSYQRMLVHRVAAYFGMEHNVDGSGNSVVVSKTKNTRLPETKFREHIRDDLLFPEEPRRSILKRDSSSFEDGYNVKSPERQFSSESRRSKSFEEREEEYEKARKRIFQPNGGANDSLIQSHDSLQNSSLRSSQEELRWPSDIQRWSSSDSDTSNRLRQSLLHGSHGRQTRLLKVESFEGRDTLKANSLRLAVSKSYSFGGYPGSVVATGESSSSSNSSRLLTKQDSGSSSMSSRLSPSSSGYKSQSQSLRSDVTLSATPSPTATPATQFITVPPPATLCIPAVEYAEIFKKTEPSTKFPPDVLEDPNSHPVMWAVSDLASIPAGSILINHQTLEAYTNPDGTLYRFDPLHPPKILKDGRNGCAPNSPKSDIETQPPETESKKSDKGTSPENIERDDQVAPVMKTTSTSPSLPVTPPTSTETPTTQLQVVSCASTTTTVVQSQIISVCPSQCPFISAPPDQTFQNVQQYLPPLPVQQGDIYGQPGSFQSLPACTVQPSPIMYASYSVPAVPGTTNGVHNIYDTRLLDGSSVSDLGPYVMGLSLADQRPNGESHQQPLLPTPTPAYQAPSSYWQPQTNGAHQHTMQTPSGMPLFYLPSTPAGGILGSSPPQQSNLANSASGANRLITLPQFPVANSVHPQVSVSSLSTVGQSTDRNPTASNCAAMSYGPMVAAAASGESLPLYTQSAVPMLYSSSAVNTINTVTSGGAPVTSSSAAMPYYASAPSLGMPPFLSSGQSFQAPTPPHTPSQNQATCNVAGPPFMYLSGPPSYGPIQQGTAAAHINQSPTTASAGLSAATSYIPPIIPNLGVFRSNVQMMSNIGSSSSPRPIHDVTVTKSNFGHGQPNRDRPGSLYDVSGSNERNPGIQYPAVPFFGPRFMPGMVGGSIAHSPSPLRMSFGVGPHTGSSLNHRIQSPGFQCNQAAGSGGSNTSTLRFQKQRKHR